LVGSLGDSKRGRKTPKGKKTYGLETQGMKKKLNKLTREFLTVKGWGPTRVQKKGLTEKRIIIRGGGGGPRKGGPATKKKTINERETKCWGDEKRGPRDTQGFLRIETGNQNRTSHR